MAADFAREEMHVIRHDHVTTHQPSGRRRGDLPKYAMEFIARQDRLARLDANRIEDNRWLAIDVLDVVYRMPPFRKDGAIIREGEAPAEPLVVRMT